MLRLTAVLFLAATTAFALEPPLAQPDAKLTRLSTDLHALARIAELSEDLRATRQVSLAMIDADVDDLRGPRQDGTYEWASLQREEGGRVRDEKAVDRVHSEEELREVTVTAPNAYRVEVRAPQKRSAFAANSRVFWRNVIVESTSFDGKTTRTDLPVGVWIAPGDSHGVALAEIGKSVKATAELGLDTSKDKAVAEVALVQAKLVDDRRSPYFPAVTRLLQIRELLAAEEIQRGAVKTAVDEAILSLPGELEKRAAAMAAMEEQRRLSIVNAEAKNEIIPGDATYDVVKALDEIGKLLGGTLEEQTAGRARLAELLTAFRPQ